MRILFFTHYFPPEVNAPANRTFEHCRVWAEAGHEVHVVTCVPSHPEGRPFPGYRRGWYQREEMDGIHVHRVWTYLAPNRGVLRRTLNYLSFIPTSVFRALRLDGADVIVATSPQFFCAVAGRLAAGLRKTPWVFELRDLWPESIQAVGAVRRSWALRLLERLELHLYHRASAIVCVTKSFVEILARRGIDSAKLHYVPNGTVPAFWSGGDRATGRERLGLADDEIAATYIGTLGMAHDLGNLLSAAKLLQESHPTVRCAIVGEGAQSEALRARTAELGLTNVTFTGLLPRQEIVDIMAGSDISLVTLKPSETFLTVLPSKMFESMAAGKPVILAVDGEAKAVLESSGGGIPVTPGNADELAATIGRLASSPALRSQLGSSGASFVSREFNREVWARRYLGLLVSAIGVRGCSSPDGRATSSLPMVGAAARNPETRSTDNSGDDVQPL